MSEIQIHEADLKLLQFKTYEEYLDSLVTAKDLFYLESITIVRKIARLGYLTAVKTYDEAVFYSRRNFVKNLLYPTHKVSLLASDSTKPTNDLQRELSLREQSNRFGNLSTIIFASQSDKRGYTRSAYIDFAHRLVTEDWVPFFRSKQKLIIRNNDLVYYNTYTGKTVYNESPNYIPFIDRRNKLIFQNVHDGKYLNLDLSQNKWDDVEKFNIEVKGYDLVILFDYVPRRKLKFFR